MVLGLRSRHRRPERADVALATGLALLGLVEVWLSAPTDRLLGTVTVLGLTVPLAWRRTAPLATALVVCAVLAATVLWVVPIHDLVMFIPVLTLLLYSLGAHAQARRSLLGLAVAVATVCTGTLIDSGPGVDNLLFGLVVVLGPWSAGRLVRRRTGQAVELALQAQRLELSQAERERTAVAAERVRIARELHDVIAHSVSVMTVQAGAVEAVLDSDIDKARAAAGSIRRTGRQAQADMRRLLGLLRDDDAGSDGLAPQPGLSRLDELVDSVRRAGVEVRVAVDGPSRPLPPGVDLAAFRVVQESLTNVLKHAHASSATVGLRYGDAVVDIDVADDGSAAPDSDHVDGGHGVPGMRERVALYGGSFECGRHAGGGFHVHARLPIVDGG